MDVSVKLVANADPLSGGQALLIAQTLIEGFNHHYRLFRDSSASAKARFEQGDWQGCSRRSRNASPSTTTASPKPSSGCIAISMPKPR